MNKFRRSWSLVFNSTYFLAPTSQNRAAKQATWFMLTGQAKVVRQRPKGHSVAVAFVR